MSCVIEVGLGEQAHVGSLGEVLAQKPIGVFVGSSLPRRFRIAEVDVDADLADYVGECLAVLLSHPAVKKQFHAQVRTIDRGPIDGPARNLELIAREIQTCDDSREFDKGLNLIIQAIQTQVQQPPKAH